MPGKTTDAHPAQILVVDDDPILRELLRTFFTGCGYEVAEAADGDRALDVLGERHIDLVVTDVTMPNCTGPELLEEIARLRPSLPVIMITGEPSVELAVECLKKGAADFLGKPLDLTALRQAADKALGRAEAEATTAVAPVRVGAGPLRRLGNYLLDRLIGEGNMGRVYLGHKEGRPASELFAIKILKPRWNTEADRDMAMQRFLREAKAASAVHHPGIVRIFEFGAAAEDGLPYMVMEYLQGRSLKWFIAQRKPLSYRQKTRIVQQLAEALAAIHAKGICHRDVKPANIILDNRLQPKITDFGVARLPGSELTGTCSLIGSPAYLAPEAFLSPKVSPSADIFSLGVVAYEFLVGCKPFHGDSIPALAGAIQRDKPTDPRRLDPEFPGGLRQVLARMLRKRPEDRYTNMEEVVADLETLLARENLKASLLEELRAGLPGGDWR